MACWFYTDDLTITETLMSIVNSTQNPGLDGFALDVSGTEAGDPVRAWHQRGGGAGMSTAKSTAGPGANAWHHGCAVFSITHNRVYLDAANSHIVIGAHNPVAADRTCIAHRYFSGAYSKYWSGRIAEAAIWNTDLTGADVRILGVGYSPLLVKPQNLVAYWPLIRDQDYDSVGGYDMTPINAPTIASHTRVLYPTSPFAACEGGAPASVPHNPLAMTGLSGLGGIIRQTV